MIFVNYAMGLNKQHSNKQKLKTNVNSGNKMFQDY